MNRLRACWVRTGVMALFLAFGVVTHGRAIAIEVTGFHVDARLRKSGELIVTEDIRVNFGEVPRHGIYRTIPVVYDRDAQFGSIAVPAKYRLRLALRDVTDDRRQKLSVKTTREGRNIRFRIGDPNRTVTGPQTYRITYRVERAINFFDDHEELYWNVTGNDWEWPILRSSIVITLPEGVDPRRVRTRTFTGLAGSTSSTATHALSGRTFTAEAALGSIGEGLTVVLALPKGSIPPPDRWRKLAWFLADNGIVIAVFLVPVVVFGGMLSLFLRNGRDPERNLPITAQYDPPSGLSPAELGTLVDERADTTDIVSTVIDLAVRGYLKIREMETTKLLFFTSRDYEFTRLKANDDSLEKHERLFLNGMFSSGDSVLLSDLKNRFYVTLPNIRDALYDQLVSKKMFPLSPDQVRKRYLHLAVLSAVVPLFIIIPLIGFTMEGSGPLAPAASVVSFLITALILGGFSQFMPRKTLEGCRAARHAFGFREFVRRVEADRIRRMATDDPTLFERLLPFAMVLGVADEWADRFKDLLTSPPDWYDSPRYGPGSFHSHLFINDLGQGMNSMASTFTSSPQSNSAGGGGSGFGGGGSSGGGFGGGGGGGW